MATTTSAPTHGHLQPQQQPPYDPLRRMRGLDAKWALRASPRLSAAATAALLVPLGAALLGASGLALAATLAGLAVAAPLLVVFSPVFVPAALAAALAAAGALGVAGVSALAWAVRYLWQRRGGGVTGMVVQPLGGHGAKRIDVEGPDAFVGHRLQPRTQDIDIATT